MSTNFAYQLRFDLSDSYGPLCLPEHPEWEFHKKSAFNLVATLFHENGLPLTAYIAALEKSEKYHFQCIVWSSVLLTHSLRNKLGTLYHNKIVEEKSTMIGYCKDVYRQKDPTKKKDQVLSLTKARSPLKLSNYCLKEDKFPLTFKITDEYLVKAKHNMSHKAAQFKFQAEVSTLLDPLEGYINPDPSLYKSLNSIHYKIYNRCCPKAKFFSTLYMLNKISVDQYCSYMHIFPSY